MKLFSSLTLMALLPLAVAFHLNPLKKVKQLQTTPSQLFGGQGFGKRSSTNEDEAKKGSGSIENLKRIYSAPALYDLAMGYRNYESEVEFLLDSHEKVSGQKAKSVIEVASGPGRHCMEALSSKLVDRAIALDLSPEMVEYGRGVAREVLDNDMLSSKFTFLCDDMRTFELEEPCDSAWILAGSLQHMTTNEDVIACLKAIHRSLTPKGTLILELPHPNEVFNMIESTTNSWDVPLDDDNGKEYGELHVVWGDENDEIDPIQQVRQNTVVLNLTGVEDAEKKSIRGVVPLKLFTAQEMELFARCSGFKVAAMYGALSEEVDINNEDTAYRLVCILQKP
ncbi:Methyltransferase domain [Seminavis robusta]|uniref:Methyltransferase domain n=1 Tax=Seminavis robusta TaxID=568900 RepID=A0A9N8DJ75_9STRA|nr:Methyltransferase domain [Seminavis robusta]|eukprot:Sro157_g071190.1 Methyltransferase domain (338) ;mRNA; r:52012-53025